MPLTPDDVQSKEFLTVRLREGYDMQEVDQFLDEVEAELRRLSDENERLRNQLAEAAEGGPAAAAVAAGVSETGIQRAISDPSEVPQAALRILTHAQKTADELVDDARSQAEVMVSDAMAEAERLRTESEAAAETLRADSSAEAEGVIREARGRAEELDIETENRRAELLGELELAQSKLQVKVEDLRAHEREYRSRLTAYHEAQVRKLRSGELDELEPSTDAIPSTG